MTQQDVAALIANHPYQARLAESLISTPGLEGAAHACQANTWDGVLQCVLAYQTDSRGAGT